MRQPRPVVLLVEDERDDIEFVRRAFSHTGVDCDLQVVQDGRSALDYLAGTGAYQDRASHPVPTHLLLDLKLPGTSGLDVLTWIRTQPTNRTLPVIVLTSSNESSDRERCHALGIDLYLVKPVSYGELIEVVRRIASRWNLAVTSGKQ